VTPNPGFKVTVYLQVEYLKNGEFAIWNLVSAQGIPNASMMWLPDGSKSFNIGLVVLIQYRLWRRPRQTDRQTDRQTRCRS